MGEMILEQGVDVNEVDTDPCVQYPSALMGASSRGHSTVVRVLIGAGADVNLVAQSDYTALMGTAVMAASNGGHEAVVRMLIEAGANLNNQATQRSWTALMWASRGGHEAVVRVLLQAGAAVNVPTMDILRGIQEALRESDLIEALAEAFDIENDESEETMRARYEGTVATLQAYLSTHI